MASPSRNRAAVGRFLQAAAADRAGRVDAVFLLALLKIPKCALPATALFSSDRRAIWPPLPEARACGCFRHRAGRNTNCRRRCYREGLALGATALRVPGKLYWDANKRQFLNSEAANGFPKPYLRKGWELKV